MFDLNEAVAAWRNELSARGSFRRSDIDELEAHLRDEMDALKSHSLSEQEAFWVAAHRLGKVDALTLEYAKVNPFRPWLSRLSWVAAGVLAYHVLGALANIVAAGSLFLGALGGMEGYALGTLAACTQFLALAAVAAGAAWRLASSRSRADRVLRGPATARWPAAVAITLGVLLLTLANLGATAVVSVWVVRKMGMSDLARAMLVRSYAGLAWTLALPVFLVPAIIWLRRRAQADAASPAN